MLTLSSMESPSSRDARRSLAAIGESRQGIADRLATRRWYYPVLGFLMAQMILAAGLAPTIVAVLSPILAAVGMGLLVRTHTGRAGLVGRFPSAARSLIMLGLFALGIMLPVLWVVFADELATGVVIALALATFTSTNLLGPAYDAVYRADLRREGTA